MRADRAVNGHLRYQGTTITDNFKRGLWITCVFLSLELKFLVNAFHKAVLYKLWDKMLYVWKI